MKREHFEHISKNTRPRPDGARFHTDDHGARGRSGFGPGGFGPGFGAGMPGWGGPEAWGRGRRRGKGDVRSAILSLLADTDSLNGYAIMKAIGEKTEGAWRVSPGSVYPTLQQLVDEGLIVPRGEGRGTEFGLTDDGRAYVTENAEDLAKAWAGVPRPSESGAAFVASVGKLMGVVGQFRHGATDAQRAAAVEKLDEARRALYLILAD
jgi:DNA-binding PadR family transcriptional regulator